MGPYAIGLLVLAGAVTVLRSRAVPVFVEQLAVPGLAVGIGGLVVVGDAIAAFVADALT